MSLTGKFGATEATELAGIFTAADLRVSAELDINGLVDPVAEASFSNEGPVLGGMNM